MGLFGGPKEPKPIKPPAASNKDVQDAARAARQRAAYAKGRSSTNIVGNSLGTVG